jgi:hypothetical protein
VVKSEVVSQQSVVNDNVYQSAGQTFLKDGENWFSFVIIETKTVGARPHTTACNRALLNRFNWELFDHPLYSLDLAPSGCHFTYLKN